MLLLFHLLQVPAEFNCYASLLFALFVIFVSICSHFLDAEKYEVSMTYDFKRKVHDIQLAWNAYLALLENSEDMLRQKKASVRLGLQFQINSLRFIYVSFGRFEVYLVSLIIYFRRNSNRCYCKMP